MCCVSLMFIKSHLYFLSNYVTCALIKYTIIVRTKYLNADLNILLLLLFFCLFFLPKCHLSMKLVMYGVACRHYCYFVCFLLSNVSSCLSKALEHGSMLQSAYNNNVNLRQTFIFHVCDMKTDTNVLRFIHQEQMSHDVMFFGALLIP